MSIFYTTAPSFFQFSGLSGFFYEANSLVNFVNVFFLCVQNRQKKTIQPKQLSIEGWYNEENTFLRKHSLKSSFWDICVYVCTANPVWFIEFRTWTFPWLPIQARNLWLLFPLALLLLLSSCHEKVIKWQLFLFKKRYWGYLDWVLGGQIIIWYHTVMFSLK